jgi:TRAP-type C4-dicarboxylate transport system substrate-binding protein
MEALGASALALAGAEQYTALQRGTADGTDFPWYTMEQYKFYEVLNHIVTPALHTPGVVEMIINSKALNALSAEQQKAVRQASLNAMNKSFEDAEKLDRDAIANSAKLGVKISVISAANMKKFQEACKPLWDAEATRSPYSAKLVKILRDHLKSKGMDK